MALHPDAGKPAPKESLVWIPRLVAAYYRYRPDHTDPKQAVSFGTSGHRGCSFSHSFNQDHIWAITQAICDYRKEVSISGPLFLGMDTHALSEPALMTALEVLAGNGVATILQPDQGYLPTPVISHAILSHNRQGGSQADGIVITPSHNPPEDGGLKYNPPSAGPADAAITGMIENRANQLLAEGLKAVQRIGYEKALRASCVQQIDLLRPYLEDLQQVVDLSLIKQSGLRLGVDPMGGSSLGVYQALVERYHLDLQIVNPKLDPTFGFMPLDKDGKIRMDCSSAYAMTRLVDLKDQFDLAFGNDPDADRHGVVTKSAGLLNPNHYLSAVIWYLFQHRPQWSPQAGVGKTLVSSSMIDRVVAHLGRPLYEVPVGFKWFVEGLLSGSYAFGGEESAGATCLRMDGSVWTTDKDGIVLNLLAAEMTARLGKDPAQVYQQLQERFGSPVYERIDAPATDAQKKALSTLSAQSVRTDNLAGEPILQKLTHAPANGKSIGGLKVVSQHAWFAARPSGTEAVYKIYAESFLGKKHLQQVQHEAQQIVAGVFARSES